MKMSLIALAALTLLAAMPAAAEPWHDDFTPRAPDVVRPGHMEWAWDGSDGLGVSVPATVHYQRGGPVRIVITGPDATLRHLRVGQGQIRHDNSPGLFRDGHLDITVSGVALHDVMLAGSPDMDLGRLDQDELNLAIHGSGKARAEGRVDRLRLAIHGSGEAMLGQIRAQRADVEISGSGRMGASGQIGQVAIAIHGSGRAAMDDVSTRRADIAITGSGEAAIAPHDAANIAITGSGDVHLTARPAQIHRSVRGSGNIDVTG
ncbi:MAG: DUF2807 domain-containing protein [Alphaproteobacteria bacterium]|nr:DUF2807 domain-containing protein [Alphaproteobacteria bacterium]